MSCFDSIFLSQNYRGIRTIKRQEELLDTHLNRLIIENDKYEKLFRNGLLVTRLNDYYRNKYFDEKINLKLNLYITGKLDLKPIWRLKKSTEEMSNLVNTSMIYFHILLCLLNMK